MKLFSKMKGILFDEKIPLNNRLLTVILTCIIAGTIIGLIPMLFGNTKGWWLNLLMLAFGIISQIFNVCLKKPKTAMFFISFTGIIIALPIMYFEQGGYLSGMPFWFVFAILTVFIMIEGIHRYVSVIIAIIIFSGCILCEYFFPETVTYLPTKESVFTDILVSFSSTMIIYLIMLDVYLKAYKKKRENLNYALHYDALTGIENRYAYENYLKELNQVTDNENLVLISADVNGLKVTNDTLGHSAGDELLVGAAEVFTKTFGAFGRVFRTGGDEFQATIFTDSDISDIQKAFEENMTSWKGTLVPELHISIGYACSKDFKDMNCSDLAKIADGCMYKDKADFYKRNGINRRNN